MYLFVVLPHNNSFQRCILYPISSSVLKLKKSFFSGQNINWQTCVSTKDTGVLLFTECSIRFTSSNPMTWKHICDMTYYPNVRPDINLAVVSVYWCNIQSSDFKQHSKEEYWIFTKCTSITLQNKCGASYIVLRVE